jgi:hypothetical protein
VVCTSRGIGIIAFTVAGILAAILPGRRAARVDMLWAISTA